MISAIVVSYNARDHLRRCLERLETEGELLGETIVVDNGSGDGSPEMVRDGFPTCRLLELGKNVGFGVANNRGAELAQSDALLLINSDAWLASGSLGALHQALEVDSRRALVAPALRYPDGRRQFAWVPETGVVGEALQMARNRFENARFNHLIVPPLLRALTGPGWFTAACVLVRKNAFESIGGFDEELFLYFEDVDLCRRLRQADWKLAQAPGATAFHVKGGSGDDTSSELEYRRAQLAYYRKHRPAWENRYLRSKQRRKFSRVENPELRRALLALLEEGA